MLQNYPDDKKLQSKMLHIRADYYVGALSGYDDEITDVEELDSIIKAYKQSVEYAEGKDKEEIEKQIDKFESLKNYQLSLH